MTRELDPAKIFLSLVLSLPEIFEPLRGKFSVPGGVLDVAMAEPLLDSARVMLAAVGECKAAGVPEHVRVNREGKACLVADATDEPLEAGHGHRSRSLTGEDVGRRWHLIALELA